MRGTRRSISFPITVGVLSVALSVALLVGWILIVVRTLSGTNQVARYAWLLAMGCVSFVVIITTLVLFSVFLAREARLVNRQTRFIDSVTHELKSPLASLKLCLQTQERNELSREQKDELRKMMVDDVQRLSNFIDDVLEASQLPATRTRIATDLITLRELVSRQVTEVVRYYELPAAAIRTRIPAELTLVTDRTALETIVKNLLDNAVKYSLDLDRPVDVEIDAHRQADVIRIAIRDQGIGIPRKHRRRIFERFFRVPDEAVKKQHGTGLGLYVASALARLLDGKIEAESSEGHGTVMRVILPARRRELAAAAARTARLTESNG